MYAAETVMKSIEKKTVNTIFPCLFVSNFAHLLKKTDAIETLKALELPMFVSEVFPGSVNG